MPKLKNISNPSGPIQSNEITIIVDRNLCIGAATCMAIAPKAFDIDSEAKAIILEGVDSCSLQELVDAAKSCPTAAITILDKNKKRIYPK